MHIILKLYVLIILKKEKLFYKNSLNVKKTTYTINYTCIKIYLFNK
jgi:hypothetical protein